MTDFVIEKLRKTIEYQRVMLRSVNLEIGDAQSHLYTLIIQRDRLRNVINETATIISEMEKGEMSIE